MLVIFSSVVLAGISPLLTTGFPKSLQLAIGEICLAIPALAYVKYKKLKFRKTFRLRFVDKKVLLACGLMGIAMPILNDELDRFIAQFTKLSAENEALFTEMLRAQSILDWTILIFGIVIIAGIVEEMLFRGLLQRTLERKGDFVQAIILSSLLFAMIHPTPWFAQIMTMGGLMGYVAWRADSIFPSIILHAFNNAFALILINVDEANIAWYDWYGHVHPTAITVAACLTFYGLKWFINLTPIVDTAQQKQ